VASGVLFGGPSPEHDISILTGLQALRELSTTERDLRGIYWTKSGAYYLIDSAVEAEAFLEGVPKGASELSLRLGDEGGFFAAGSRRSGAKRVDVDALILATHGGPGEDGTLQGALDLAGVCYSGPSVAGAALGMDKWAFGTVMAQAGLPTLSRALLSAETTELDFEGPYILKPRFGGSSIGIDVVADFDTARARLGTNLHFANGCVVEPYREDLTDVQVALRTYPALELSAIERPLRQTRGAEILNYRDKYVSGEGMVAAPRELPATLAPGQSEEVVRLARAVATLSLARGVARVDFLANDDELYVNEINTIPGSLAKYLFVDPPRTFATLLKDLLAEARERPAHRYSAAGADGLVLRKAGAIAAKLA
jgi:D-alanine-D-alanine ligase